MSGGGGVTRGESGFYDASRLHVYIVLFVCPVCACVFVGYFFLGCLFLVSVFGAFTLRGAFTLGICCWCACFLGGTGIRLCVLCVEVLMLRGKLAGWGGGACGAGNTIDVFFFRLTP